MSEVNNPLVSQYQKNLDFHKSARANADSVLEQISKYLHPHRGDFRSINSKYYRYDKDLHDITGPMAAHVFTSGLFAGTTNPNETWFNLIPSDKNLQDDPILKRYAADVVKRLMTVFNRQDNGFAQNNFKVMYDGSTYGTGLLPIFKKDNETTFQSWHLGECYIDENFHGTVDTLYRVYKLTGRQIKQQWPEAVEGSERLQREIKKDQYKEYEILNVIEPKEDAIDNGQEINKKNRKYSFISTHMVLQPQTMLGQNGYKQFPVAVLRLDQRVGEKYGRSPGWMVLSEIERLQELRKTELSAHQLLTGPMLLTPHDDVGIPEEIGPLTIFKGGVDEDGRDVVKSLRIDARPDVMINSIERSQQIIKDAYFVDQLLRDPKLRAVQPLTATESNHLDDSRERVQLPFIFRLTQDYLKPIITRTYAIEQEIGNIPPLPEGYEDVEFEIEFTGSLVNIQRQKENNAVERFMGSMVNILSFAPETRANFDWDEITRELFVNYGGGIDKVFPKEQVLQQRQQEQQQAQMAQANEQANLAADSANKLGVTGNDIMGALSGENQAGPAGQ